MRHDVIVVGGGYAGMAAALQLVRARRNVLVIDGGKRRNRFAKKSHGFLSQDGADPAEIAAIARRQLETYPTLAWRDGTAVAATGQADAFTVGTSDGEQHEARRIIIATGLSDTLPDIPGMAERWGKYVFHCPYCHGYELNQGDVGVIAASPMSQHQAQLLTEWGRTTFFLNGAFTPTEEERTHLASRASSSRRFRSKGSRAPPTCDSPMVGCCRLRACSRRRTAGLRPRWQKRWAASWRQRQSAYR